MLHGAVTTYTLPEELDRQACLQIIFQMYKVYDWAPLPWNEDQNRMAKRSLSQFVYMIGTHKIAVHEVGQQACYWCCSNEGDLYVLYRQLLPRLESSRFGSACGRAEIRRANRTSVSLLSGRKEMMAVDAWIGSGQLNCFNKYDGRIQVMCHAVTPTEHLLDGMMLYMYDLFTSKNLCLA